MNKILLLAMQGCNITNSQEFDNEPAMLRSVNNNSSKGNTNSFRAYRVEERIELEKVETVIKYKIKENA